MELAVDDKRAIVVGGGISGLASARKLMEAGYAVDLYEAGNRVGGKIQSAQLGDKTVNAGAEFIDSDHAGMLELAKKLNVKLIASTDQNKAEYVTPSGKKLSEADFTRAVLPIQKRIIEDKKAIAKDPDGVLARSIDSKGLDQYLQEKAAEVAAEPKSLTERIGGAWNSMVGAVMPGRHNVSPQDTVAMITNIYVAEALRDPKNISALQLVNEVSEKTDQFLAADCAYRVEGGTEKLITALRDDLKSKGLRVMHGAEATGISKRGDNFIIDFKDGTKQSAAKVVLALPTKALGKIDGLEALGLSTDAVDTLKAAQYTHTSKFSIAMKGDAPNQNWYSNEGLQSWRSQPGVMTFLVGGETLNQQKGKDLVQHCLDNYAAAHGTTAEKLFDTGKVAYSGVDLEKPCYFSPAPGQATKMMEASRELDKLAESGLGVAGTFIPKRVGGNAAVGFMDCGVEAANRAVGLMVGKERDAAQEAPMLTTKFQDQVKAERKGRGAVEAVRI